MNASLRRLAALALLMTLIAATGGGAAVADLPSPGTPDPTFMVGEGFDASVDAAALQPDGRILLSGEFSQYQQTSAHGLIRLLPDGTADPSFATGTGFDGPVEAIRVQADGKILVGGTFTQYNGEQADRLVRLNPDGSRDAAFSSGQRFDDYAPGVYAIAEQPDGKILVGGKIITFDGHNVNDLVRLNPDGTWDPTFSADTKTEGIINSLLVQSSGKIITGRLESKAPSEAINTLVRLDANGDEDSGFAIGTGTNGTVIDLVAQPDGKILVTGPLTKFDNHLVNGLFRIHPDGRYDPTFTTGTGFDMGPGRTVWPLALQDDGKILVGGNFTHYNGTPANGLIRLLPDGHVDPSFVTGTGFRLGLLIGPHAILVQPDGKIIVGGYFSTYQGQTFNMVMRLIGTNPGIAVTPTTVAFGEQAVGSRTTGTFSIRNSGDGRLTISAVAVQGVDSDQFTVDAASCTASPVGAGASCPVSVAFAPTSKGTKSAEVRITSDAAEAPSVSLTGTGTASTPKARQYPRNRAGRPPHRIKLTGLTVLTGRNARTNADQRISTRVLAGTTAAGEVRPFRVIRGPQGKVSIRTYGARHLKIVLVQSAPATKSYSPYRKRTVYVGGARRTA